MISLNRFVISQNKGFIVKRYLKTNNVSVPDRCLDETYFFPLLLSTPMSIDYVVIGFAMEVQPLVTHNAA